MLPTFLRLRRVFVCRALCSPLYLGDDTGLYPRSCGRVATIYRVELQRRVCYLRAALNDAFNLKKGFEIEDARGATREWVYAKDPTMPNQLLAVDERRRTASP